MKVGFCSETLEEATLITLIKMACILNNEGVCIMCHSYMCLLKEIPRCLARSLFAGAERRGE